MSRFFHVLHLLVGMKSLFLSAENECSGDVILFNAVSSTFMDVPADSRDITCSLITGKMTGCANVSIPDNWQDLVEIYSRAKKDDFNVTDKVSSRTYVSLEMLLES